MGILREIFGPGKGAARGSMTLEASLIIPLFLVFILILTNFVNLVRSEAGLRTAMYQTVQQLAVQMYPLDIMSRTKAGRQIAEELYGLYSQYEDGKNQVMEWIDDYGQLMPEQVRGTVASVIAQAEKGEDQMMDPIRQAFKPLLVHYLPEHMAADRIHIESVHIPVLSDHTDPLVVLEATYEVPIIMPFFSHSFFLHVQSVERAWSGYEGQHE